MLTNNTSFSRVSKESYNWGFLSTCLIQSVVISSFPHITFDDKGDLIEKRVADFCRLHVNDQVVYSCSSAGISKDGSCNGLDYYVALERDFMEAATVNLVVGEQPADVYIGNALSVSRKDYATDSNSLLAELLIDQIEKTLVKHVVVTSVNMVIYVMLREQYKRRLEEKGLINDDRLLFCASCYAAKFYHGASDSFVQMDSLSTMVNKVVYSTLLLTRNSL